MRRAMMMGVAVVAVVAAVAGCGGSSSGSSSGDEANKTVTLKVGYIPIADVAPLFVGIKQGYFAQEHLKIEPQEAAGGAAIVPAVQSGDEQIGFSSIASTLLAAEKGLQLPVVGMGAQAGPDAAHDYAAVIVRKDSPIRSPQDLAGKKIAINTLKTIEAPTIKAALAKDGVDPSGVTFTEVEYPDMESAVQQGRVAAASTLEPFLTMSKRAGLRTVLYPFSGTAPNLTISTWFTSQRYLSEHRDVVERFTRAITKADVYAQAHPEVVRKVVRSYTKLSASIAKAMRLPTWSRTVNKSSMELFNRIAVKYGLYPKPVDIDGLFPDFVPVS